MSVLVEEIYAGIVARIKVMYQDRITDAQSYEAAKNLIGFCRLILNFKCERQENPKKKGDKEIVIKNLIDLKIRIS